MLEAAAEETDETLAAAPVEEAEAADEAEPELTEEDPLRQPVLPAWTLSEDE
jgi:hypothetical protein